MIDRDTAPWAWRAVSVALLLLAVAVTVSHYPSRVAPQDPRIYVDAAESVIRAEYQTASEPDGVPRYPPGFPIMLAPFVAGWGDDGARAASIVIGALLVGSVWLAALRVGGHRAAVIAALLWSSSPLVKNYSTDVMSDPAGALFVMAAFLAARRGRWILAAVALGWSTWIRIIHVVFLGGLGRRGAAWVVAAIVLLPLAVFQLRTYGRLAGYDGGDAQFSLSNITGDTPLVLFTRPSPWSNWQFFPGLLWGLQGGLVPVLPLFAGYELVARRADPSARLAAWIIVTNVAVYLPYYYQAPRFVQPAACLVIVFAAAGAVRLVDTIRAARGDEADPHPAKRMNSRQSSLSQRPAGEQQ